MYDKSEDFIPIVDIEDAPPFHTDEPDPDVVDGMPEKVSFDSFADGHHNLKIIGSITHFLVTPYWSFLNRVVGELDFDWNWNGIHSERGGCLGTIMSKDSVLTAGYW